MRGVVCLCIKLQTELDTHMSEQNAGGLKYHPYRILTVAVLVFSRLARLVGGKASLNVSMNISCVKLKL